MTMQAARLTLGTIKGALVTSLVLLLISASGLTAAETLDVGVKDITIEIPDSWSFSRHANVHKIYNVPTDQQSELTSQRLRRTVQITVHSDLQEDHEAALQALRVIAAESGAEVEYRTIAGWPALRRRFLAPRPMSGQVGGGGSAQGPQSLIQNDQLRAALLSSPNGEAASAISDDDRRIAAEIAGKATPEGAQMAARALRAKASEPARHRMLADRQAKQSPSAPVRTDPRLTPGYQAIVSGQAISPDAAATAGASPREGPALFIDDGWKQPPMGTAPIRTSPRRPVRTNPTKSSSLTPMRPAPAWTAPLMSLRSATSTGTQTSERSSKQTKPRRTREPTKTEPTRASPPSATTERPRRTSPDRTTSAKPTRTPTRTVPSGASPQSTTKAEPRRTSPPQGPGAEVGAIEGKGGAAQPGIGLLPPGEKPRVVRYSCCDGVDVRGNASLDSTSIGQLAHSELVWIHDIVGTGAPSGVGGCGGASASCGTLWAEVFVPGSGLSGYVQLNALFIRPIKPKASGIVFELGYGRLARYLRSGIQSELVQPAGCGDLSNTLVLKGSDVGHADSYFIPVQTLRRTCNDILTTPCTYGLHTCEKLSPGDEGFASCVYADLAECQSGGKPNRAPRSSLNICVETCPLGRAPCAGCREWYEETGQSQTGWLTANQLVDSCLSKVEQGDSGTCVGGGFPGGGGGGGGGQGGQTTGHSIDPVLGSGDDRDPGDPDLPPLPQPSEPAPQSTPSSLMDGPQVTGAAGACVNECAEHMKTWQAAACGHYIGPVDERRFGDPYDYECGEVPIGQTHFGYREDTATGMMAGAPDHNWKVLTKVTLPEGKVGLVQLGRKSMQKSFQFSTLDLTTGTARTVNAPASVDAGGVWLSFHPKRSTVRINNKDVTKDTLFVDACVHLPGNRVDGGSVTYHPTDKLFGLVRGIDLGAAEFRKVKFCAVARAYLDDQYNPKVDVIDIYDLSADITAIDGVDIKWGPGAIAGSFVPILGTPLLAAIIAVEAGEAWVNKAAAGVNLATFAMDAYSGKIIGHILPTLKSEIANALTKARINPREQLQSVCEQLDPNVGQSHPYHYFYRFLRWQCDGFTGSHTLRPFQVNHSSESQGCYEDGAFITPADADASRWWAAYQGQSWVVPFFPDSGCRIGATMQSTLDEDVWPTLTCATAIFNIWLNNGPQPAGATLGQMVSANCRQAGLNALGAYYGNGQDLVQLYQQVHQPTTHSPTGTLKD